MFKNYFKTAWRNLVKNKGYSVINIGGLAVGMAIAMLIGLWVYDEVSYNQSYKNHDRIAEVSRLYTEPLSRETSNSVWLPQPMAKVLRNNYGQLFKHVMLTRGVQDFNIKIGSNNFTKRGEFIEDGVIDMLSLKMLKGNNKSLSEMQNIIISESTAKALFGNDDPINKSIRLNNRFDAKVTGVYKNQEANSTFGEVEFFANYENLLANSPEIKKNETVWSHTSHFIYVQLADNVSMEKANAAINQLYEKDAPSDFAEGAKKYKAAVWLYPMDKWYLHSEFKNGYPDGGRITYVWLFGIVGIFVLLLACINFMNLSTARSEKRSKEVGIRKAVGSMRSSLIFQFLSESFLVVLFAFVIAMFLAYISIPVFNGLAGKSIQFPVSNFYFWILSLLFLIITSLLAGIYPALYLSSFKPIKVLKGTIHLGKYASYPRKILVVLQFTVSIVLIIGTVVVYRQIQYAQNRPVGYNRESLLQISMFDPDFLNNKLAVKQALLASGVASEIGFSSSPVTSIWDNWGGFSWRGKNPESESSFSVTWVNEDFGKTIGWHIKQGRDYSKDFSTDSSAVIINEATAKYIGLKNPVGEFITFDADGTKRQIIGVVDDIVAESPYEPVRIGFYWLQKNTNNLGLMNLKLNPNVSMNAALPKIEAVFKKIVPSAPFQYKFADEEFARKFSAEQKVSKLATIFAVLAIFISCLGIFGLASFVAEQRTKEIGVRKILGASTFNLWKLLSKDFVMLVTISLVVATPVAYYFMQNWLQNYQYRTELSWWIFAVAGVGALLITLITVSFQSIKAALANPVKSLRSE
ncbi:MAG: ABC transporter permease [Bacteroidetes bacterium]|nr:ABC transporter permease [Bacteroidota bacterium]